MRSVNWMAVFFGSVVYVVALVVIGDLIVNTGGEEIGPIADLVITFLLVLIVSYISSRKTEEKSLRILSGLLTGLLCAIWQTLLTLMTVKFGLLPFLLRTTSFLAASVLSGKTAERL